MALVNLDRASLTIKGTKISNYSGSHSVLIKQIEERYRKNIIANMVKAIGYLDFLGNPLGLFTNIADGF